MPEYSPERDYDHRKPTSFRPGELDTFVGWKGVLPLTGRFVEVRESDNGPFVMFEPDQRWGFPYGTRFGMDMEAFRGVER